MLHGYGVDLYTKALRHYRMVTNVFGRSRAARAHGRRSWQRATTRCPCRRRTVASRVECSALSVFFSLLLWRCPEISPRGMIRMMRIRSDAAATLCYQRRFHRVTYVDVYIRAPLPHALGRVRAQLPTRHPISHYPSGGVAVADYRCCRATLPSYTGCCVFSSDRKP